MPVEARNEPVRDAQFYGDDSQALLPLDDLLGSH